MKKIALWGIAALCLGFTACDDFETPNPPAQSNQPDKVLETTSLVYAQAPQAQATINLQSLENEGGMAQLADVSLESALPAGYELKNVLQLSASDNFEKSADVATKMLDGETPDSYIVAADPADLQDAINAVASKAPVEQTLYVRFAAYAVNGSSEARFGDPDYYYGPYTIKVQPLDPEKVISSAYYLIGTVSDNTVAKALKLNHSDASAYDDPSFYVMVNITADQSADGFKWKVISEEAFKSGNLKTPGTVFGQENEDEDYMEGTLFPNTADFEPGYGVVYEEGPHMFTFDMDKLTYTIALTIENLYTPGGSNGWNQAASQMLYTTDYANYMGFAHLNGEFKFTSQPDWNGINFGNAGEEGKLSTDGGAGNLSASADALYWCQANITSLTYSITEITSCGVIGELNGWGGQEALTPSADFLTWTGTIDFGAGGEWKIRFNDNWDINLGGEMNDLSVGGANMKASAGVHKVTLNLGSLPYTVAVE